MRQLDSGARALRMDEAGDPLKFGDVVIFPDAEIGGGDAAFRKNRGCLDHDQSCATLGAAAEMNEVPVVGEAVVRGVLAHGRDADAVGEGDGAKLQRRKKRMTHE